MRDGAGLAEVQVRLRASARAAALGPALLVRGPAPVKAAASESRRGAPLGAMN